MRTANPLVQVSCHWGKTSNTNVDTGEVVSLIRHCKGLEVFGTGLLEDLGHFWKIRQEKV